MGLITYTHVILKRINWRNERLKNTPEPTACKSRIWRCRFQEYLWHPKTKNLVRSNSLCLQPQHFGRTRQEDCMGPGDWGCGKPWSPGWQNKMQSLNQSITKLAYALIWHLDSNFLFSFSLLPTKHKHIENKKFLMLRFQTGKLRLEPRGDFHQLPRSWTMCQNLKNKACL